MNLLAETRRQICQVVPDIAFEEGTNCGTVIIYVLLNLLNENRVAAGQTKNLERSEYICMNKQTNKTNKGSREMWGRMEQSQMNEIIVTKKKQRKHAYLQEQLTEKKLTGGVT